VGNSREPRRALWRNVAFTKVAKMRRWLGNFLLLVSVLIAGGWIWFAVERLGARLEEWERVYVVAGFIVLVGLALRYFLAGDEENTME
jgi:sterol desaturase/sphingolipid hydroxylase (fatty acid hydroxylase superfamily)